MSEAQTQLRKLYESHWPAMSAQISRLSKDRAISFPLLVNVDSTAYFSAPIKVVVVGQETFGWGGDAGSIDGPDAVDNALKAYEEFALGKAYSASPFWTGSHEFYRRTNPNGPDRGFAWTNLVRVDEGCKRPKEDIETIMSETFNVLADEIAILAPHAVVFFTGPNYDLLLARAFTGIEFQSCVNRPVRHAAIIKHKALPLFTFRTYHPSYLRRGKKWDIIKEIAELVRTAPELIPR